MHAVHEQLERVQRLTRLIQELVAQWHLAPLVNSLQALRGVSLIVAELGDLTRFESAKQLMAYLGLVPSEHSSGGTVKRGGITKTGNGPVRRALIEASHAYSHPARESRVLLTRLEGLPQEEIRDIAWKAQVRLCGRFRRLMARGKSKNTVIAATARELAAFMWAIARTLDKQPIATGKRSTKRESPRTTSVALASHIPAGHGKDKGADRNQCFLGWVC